MNKLKHNSFKLFIFSFFSILFFYLILTVDNLVADAFDDNDLNVYFTNLNYNDHGIAKITNGGKDISFDCNLENVNDKFIITFDVINDSKLDVIVDIFKLNGINKENDKFLDYYIVYDDDTMIKEGDILTANSSKKIKLVVAYTLDDDINVYELPNENTKLNLGFQLYFGQKLN